MLYRENPKNGDKLSQLGFGCMRFPKKGAVIDIARTTEMVHDAIEKGVNYFDTAYIYPGSESALGQALSGGWREKVKIATKMPLLMVRSYQDFDKFFNKQLQRLQTDYVDYYLMHMLVDFGHFEKYRDMGYFKWAEQQKKAGRIKNIGFSFHGTQDAFIRIVDAYNWDFCMIQYNYLDENHQAGTAGLMHANKKGLPVIIMEPLRGGMLVKGLPEQAVKVFKSIKPERTLADWGLRWIWNHPEVTLLLSGMGSTEQTAQNIKTASEAEALALDEKELTAYKKVLSIVRKTTVVPCTGCGYCMPCPSNVDIPSCFSYANDTTVTKRTMVIMKYLVAHGITNAKTSYASNCKKCGKCEKHCPQGIKIMDSLDKTSKLLEPLWVKPAAKIAKVFTVGNK